MALPEISIDPCRAINVLIDQLTPLGTQDSRIAIQKLRDAQDWVRRCGITEAPEHTPRSDWASIAGMFPRNNLEDLPLTEYDVPVWPDPPVGTDVAHEDRLREFISNNAGNHIGVEQWTDFAMTSFRQRVASGENPAGARHGLEIATRNRFGLTTATEQAAAVFRADPQFQYNEISLHATLEREARLFGITESLDPVYEDAMFEWGASARSPEDWARIAEQFRSRIRGMQRYRPITQDQHDLPVAVAADMDLPPGGPTFPGDWVWMYPDQHGPVTNTPNPTI